MQEERFTIKYITVKNCFVYLSETWMRKLDPAKINAIKVSHNNNDYYVSWRPFSGLYETLGISPTFARTLNLKEGNEVTVSSLPEPPFLPSITVTPGNPQDWEIVEYQADKIQSILLDQISLVAKNQTIVVWVSRGLSVTLSIDSINSDFVYGFIGNLTEVHVSQYTNPRTTRKNSPTSQQVTSKQSKLIEIWNMFRNISDVVTKTTRESTNKEQNDEPVDVSSWITNNCKFTIPQTFRVCSLSAVKQFYSPNAFSARVESPYDVYVHRTNVRTNVVGPNDAEFHLFRIRKIRDDRNYVNSTSTDFLRSENSVVPKQSTELIVRVFFIEKIIENDSRNRERNLDTINTHHKPIYVSKNLLRNLKLQMGSKVILEGLEQSDDPVTSIEILDPAGSITRRDFEEFIVDAAINDKTLLNFPSRIFLKDKKSCMVSCSPVKCSYVLLNTDELIDIAINVNTDTSTIANALNDEDEQMEEILLDTISLEPLESMLEECWIVLELSLALKRGKVFRYDPGNVLICGNVGAGKSTLCKVLKEKMQKPPYFVYTHAIECKALKGKKAEAVHKIISAAMAECVYHQPSILFLDDLETITSSPADDGEQTPDALNAARILDVIFNIAGEYQSAHFVSIIATCTNTNKIGAKLRSPRGVHLFRTILTIPDLTQHHRIDILKLALQNNIRVPENINWDYYGSKTEGWVVRDLVDFAEKAAFAAWKRHVHDQSSAEIVLTEEDLSETLKHYKTISLHGVQLYKNSNHDWSNIGGLTNVKETLIQLLEWPLKHPELYRNSPIKNQNGVLLYGMPGTGKTILAGAIANKCDLNLISIKGPELLSKFIGASEEAVRNIFEKAQRAKPCVLFFDEFDSLAPRRGHDSTGVTDRVVNQLLTQLDGVEGREGVAVVAASSRPDLLDPALLRPGRLDKSLLCPLPDENDREEILIGLCKTQNVDTEYLDLKELAKLSSGFTGADLNAALTQAKYDALENAVANVVPGKSTYTDAIELTQKHIIDSLKATNPSLSTAEKKKYSRIYGQFSGSNIFENMTSIKRRATLA